MGVNQIQNMLSALNNIIYNILTYAENKTESFEKSPFNRVDAIILCWLSYYTYPDYLKGKKTVVLKDFEKHGLLPDKQMYAEAFNTFKSKRLFKLLMNNPRFADMKFCDYKDELDEVQEKQFAAICINVYKNKYFVAFRGTDPSLTGWKEDFNLACCYPIPAQKAGAAYLKAEMQKFPDGEFYSAGHSKGGNIAVYAAVNSSAELQKRIISVFNFDGPGFLNDVYNEVGYKNISDKIIKIVPQSSFVGMLLETRDCYEIIRSRNLSILQHDPFSWDVKDDDFCYVKDRSKFSKKLERAINSWITEIPLQDRDRMISLIYDAFSTLDMRDFNEFFKTLYKQIPALYKQYKGLETDDKDFFDEKITRLKELFDDN